MPPKTSHTADISELRNHGYAEAPQSGYNQARPQPTAANAFHAFLERDRIRGAAHSIRRRASEVLIRSRSLNSSAVSR